MAGQPGFDSRQVRIVLLATNFTPVLGPCTTGSEVLCSRVKRSGRETISSPCNADVNNAWSRISTPPPTSSWRGAHFSSSHDFTLPSNVRITAVLCNVKSWEHKSSGLSGIRLSAG